MKLSPDVYLVGGGDLGFNLSHKSDAHVYAVKSRDEVCLVDVGLGLEIETVLVNLRNDGLDPDAIGRIFVTHYHADHAGGLERWRTLTGGRVYASAQAAPAIRAGDERQVGLEGARRAGTYPEDYRLHPCPVDVELYGGESVAIGDLEINAIATSGHCDGHVAYQLRSSDRTYLFSGDCLLWGGRVIIQNIPDCRIDEYAKSMERLAAVTFDALLPGHLAISLEDGRRHLDAALSAFRSSRVPNQAISP